MYFVLFIFDLYIYWQFLSKTKRQTFTILIVLNFFLFKRLYNKKRAFRINGYFLLSHLCCNYYFTKNVYVYFIKKSYTMAIIIFLKLSFDNTTTKIHCYQHFNKLDDFWLIFFKWAFFTILGKYIVVNRITIWNTSCQKLAKIIILIFSHFHQSELQKNTLTCSMISYQKLQKRSSTRKCML